MAEERLKQRVLWNKHVKPKQAESERREYLILRKRLEARLNQLNAQQGKSNEELYAALAKINELKQKELELRANMKERINRERANAVATGVLSWKKRMKGDLVIAFVGYTQV